MTKHTNPNSASHQLVMPAVARFIRESFFQEEIQRLPEDVQEMMECLLETEFSNDLDFRIRMMRVLNTVRCFAGALEPFTEEQVRQACNQILQEHE